MSGYRMHFRAARRRSGSPSSMVIVWSSTRPTWLPVTWRVSHILPAPTGRPATPSVCRWPSCRGRDSPVQRGPDGPRGRGRVRGGDPPRDPRHLLDVRPMLSMTALVILLLSLILPTAGSSQTLDSPSIR